ncbi:hypothetical protein BIW11_06378 [Tropilaelaps mercedesae]|uniref:Uncharacterized protein n=1 Tax=Tropilaelaps mercedesae TaxID=418985 RepID=A0A1V9XYF6_9ACAR|nr:hypothetical protein BIW11_06378 [Tropilaelaps mercedesae]
MWYRGVDEGSGGVGKAIMYTNFYNDQVIVSYVFVSLNLAVVVSVLSVIVVVWECMCVHLWCVIHN